jgi:hypothetical protein
VLSILTSFATNLPLSPPFITQNMSTSSPSIEIYTGPWVDWSKGAVMGATITLSSRTAPILTATLAFFITIVGACLWRLLCFLFHQFSASPKPKDGMHHQHQLIFRNTASPSEAMRAFTELAFFWRKSGRRSFSRSLPLALFAVVFSLSLTAASILSSLVARSSGSNRLITSDNCGYFAYDNSSSLAVRTKAMTQKDLNDTIIAAAYARSCYEGNHKLNKLSCSTYEKPALSYSVVTNASCPFDDSMCLDGKVYQLDTGLIDSHKDLGINFPNSGRIGFRKVSTCAPITQRSYVETVTSTGAGDLLGFEGDEIEMYNYGGVPLLGISNNTYSYNTHALVDGAGYELDSIIASPGGSGWVPVDELARTEADVTLMFLAPNSIKYFEANDDPFFGANVRRNAGSVAGDDVIYYVSDNNVNVLGCTDQYQYCHPEDPKKCTKLTDYANAWVSIYDDKLGLNDIQQMVASRIALISRGFSIHHGIGGRGASALRAQDTVSEKQQLEIKRDQWQIEVNSWFDVGLAKLQRGMVEYATGPEFLPEGTYLQKPTGAEDLISKAMCGSQMVRIADGTTSFSVLGMSIILGVGGLIILIWLVCETVIGFVQKKMHWGDYRRVRWVMDDKLQVQRMAFEGHGMGEWTNLSGMVPVTKQNEVFAGLEHVDPDEPRLRGVNEVKAPVSSASSFQQPPGHAAPLQMQQMPVSEQPWMVPVPYKSPQYQALPRQE